MTGTSQIQSDNGLIACDVEICILLPDHYLRIDTAPFGEKRAGFRGKTVLSAIKELGRTTSPPDRLKDQILRRRVHVGRGGDEHVPGAGDRGRRLSGPPGAEGMQDYCGRLKRPP
jgi:hypothetical protein